LTPGIRKVNFAATSSLSHDNFESTIVENPIVLVGKTGLGRLRLSSPPSVIAQNGHPIPVLRVADFTAREPSGKYLLRGPGFG